MLEGVENIVAELLWQRSRRLSRVLQRECAPNRDPYSTLQRSVNGLVDRRRVEPLTSAVQRRQLLC